MSKRSVCVRWMLVVLLAAAPARGDDGGPPVARERIVLSTVYGELVLALYAEAAPKHVEQILRLVRLGAYDTTHFQRVEPGFVVQLSTIHDRLTPLTEAQRRAETDLPAEFSSEIRHRLGTLSMARGEHRDSARSSFSILLADAPHLDGRYTIFGVVESGGSVLRRILAAPRDGVRPAYRITVQRARVVEDIDRYFAGHARDPLDSSLDLSGRPVGPQSTATTGYTDDASTEGWLRWVLATIVLVGLLGYFLFNRLSSKHLLYLLMLNVLVGGFGLMALLIPIAHQQVWIAPLVFFGLFGLFRLMSRFENR